MEGFGMPKNSFGAKDTNGVFRVNTISGKKERSWIRYEDGVFEPVRSDGRLSRKKDDYRSFQWWQEYKPAQWKPQDDGAQFSWNHKVGSKDDFADQKTGEPLRQKADNQRMQTMELGRKPTVPVQLRPGMKTLLGMGAAALDRRPEPMADQKSSATPQPRNSAQDAAELQRRENRERSSAEYVRDIESWEKQTGRSPDDVEKRYEQKPGSEPTWNRDQLGKTDYYEQRARDFESRNPGQEPPGYYRGYGDKYAKRFDKLKPQLSKDGQQWLEKTKDLLQFKMESGLRDGKWKESNPEDLKKKAFDSHSDAYLEAGLADLPQEDINKILTAVDRGDLVLSGNAIHEAGETAWEMPMKSVMSIPSFLKWLMTGPSISD